MKGASTGGSWRGPGDQRSVSNGRHLPHQGLEGVSPVIHWSGLSLVSCPLVYKTVVTSLTDSYATLRVVIRQESGLVIQSRESSQEGEVRLASQRRSLRVKELEAVHSELPPTERTLHVSRAQLPVVLCLVHVNQHLRHTGGPAGLSLLRRRLRPDTVDVSRVLVSGALVAVGADLYHPTAGDGTGPGGRPLLLHLRVVRLVLTVTSAVKQPQGGAVVV